MSGERVYNFGEYRARLRPGFTSDSIGSAPPLPLQPGGGGGTYDGMDPWQQTVETRLGELRGDIRDLRGDVGDVRDGLATLTERVGHLPSKGFIVSASLIALSALAAITVFADNIRSLISG